MLINDYLKTQNITKYRFAQMCNLPYGTLNDICNGKTDITKCSGETLMKIAAALNVTVDDLLRERFGKCAFNQEKIKSIVIPIAEKHKLRSVYLFGSYARNEADENSDVDILIDREGSDIHGLLGMNDLLDEFRNALGKNVDLITLQSLYQESTRAGSADFVENVMKERIRIY